MQTSHRLAFVKASNFPADGERLAGRCLNIEGLFAGSLNPLHPNISIYILHTVLCTCNTVLTRRICVIIKSFFTW